MKERLKELVKLFFKLGCIAFGGPAVHIAMMQDEVVKKRHWITDEHFLDLISATNLIPGPNSTEITMHIGHERAGWRGLIVAGACFIFPAVVITSVLAYLYQKYGALPQVAAYIYGIKPAIVGIIISAMIALGRRAFKSIWLLLLGVMILVACIAGISEIAALFAAGAIGIATHLVTQSRAKANGILPVLFSQSKVFSNTKIFLTFLKVGAVLYGSGYVLFAFLNDELVKTGLLTHTQLADAIAVGQFTPGPVFSAATFIGWQMGGFWGAMAATAGIFLPSFIFVALLNPLIPKLRASQIMAAFLDSINAASVALILYVCIDIFKSSATDCRAILILVISLVMTFIFKKLNSAFIVLGGAMLGYVLLLIK
jgi:chromate transporter